MKLADILRLDVPLPDDPVEALIMTKARKARVTERVVGVMSELYEDFQQCIDTLDAHEELTTARLGTTKEGEA